MNDKLTPARIEAAWEQILMDKAMNEYVDVHTDFDGNEYRKGKQMNENELKNILKKHKKWLADYPDGERADLCGADLCVAHLRRADLREADLREADLTRADLTGADLSGADLRRADLSGADLDYSAWPLWCGSLDVKVEKRVAAQLAYHFCRLDCDDPEYLTARKALTGLANQFHRVEECGEVTPHD